MFVDFDVTADVIAGLKAKNHFVVCYVNAGSVEDFRSDAAKFPQTLIGMEYYPWGEKCV